MMTGPILCVDDEPSNLGLMRSVLQEEFRLVYARNGTEALEAAEKHHPAMILLDIDLPDMSGLDVARQLQMGKEAGHLPIIFVTSKSEEHIEEEGFAAGGVDYILKPISPQILKARVRSHLSLVKSTALESSYRAAIYMLGEASHFNDTDTGHHIWRMAAFSHALALASGIDPAEAALIELAAPMHDMGKVGIPEAILRKPGPLNDEEWQVMRTHTTIGRDILVKGAAPIFQRAAEIAHYHHERWNGSGYPAGLSGEAIPISARIVAIADVFDALTVKRSYKEAWAVDDAVLTVKKSAGTHFDPKLVDTFESILPKILEIKASWDAR